MDARTECCVILCVVGEGLKGEDSLQGAAAGEGFEHEVNGEGFVAASEGELAEDDGEAPARVHVSGGGCCLQDFLCEWME